MKISKVFNLFWSWSKIKIKNPIFIVGCCHSGNSLMLVILGSHHSITPIQEETAVFYKSHWEIKKAINNFERSCLQVGENRFVEKTPNHIFKINRIFDYYPDGKIILMLRGGRDVVCSIKTSNYLATMKPIKKDFTIAVDTWVNGNLEGYKYWDHPGVKVVKYEDLISRPQETLEGCVEFLEEDYTDRRKIIQIVCWSIM